MRPLRLPAKLAVLFAVALAVRAAYLVEMSRQPFFHVLVGDGRTYDLWARAIAGGDWIGKETFYQAPLYPYFLGAVYAVAGRHLMLVRAIQAALGSGACVLLALAGRRFLGERAGWLAGLLLALYPPAIFFDGMIQKSALDLVFMTLLLWLAARIEDGGGRADLVSAGLTLGGFALTRENAMVFLPVVAGWVLWRRRGEGLRKSAGAAGLILLGFAAVTVPVGIRNAVVGGEFILTTSQSGTNFYFGNHAGATGRHEPLKRGREMPEFERQDATELAEAATGRSLTPREVSDYWRGLALRWIREHPADWAALMVRKTFLVFNAVEIPDTESLELHEDHSAVLRVLSRVLGFGTIAPLAAAGAVLTWRDRRRLALLYALGASFTGAVALFYVFARYRYPLVPLLLLFAAAAPFGAASAWRRAERAAVAAGGAALALAAVAVSWPLLPSTGTRAGAYGNFGVGFVQEGRLDLAERYYRQAIALAPGEPEFHYNLAVALASAGRTQEAASEYARVIELDPASVAARDNLGVLLAQDGQLDPAEVLFREAARLDPSDPSPRTNLGNLATLRGRAEEAERWYREAEALRRGGRP